MTQQFYGRLAAGHYLLRLRHHRRLRRPLRPPALRRLRAAAGRGGPLAAVDERSTRRRTPPSTSSPTSRPTCEGEGISMSSTTSRSSPVACLVLAHNDPSTSAGCVRRSTRPGLRPRRPQDRRRPVPGPDRRPAAGVDRRPPACLRLGRVRTRRGRARRLPPGAGELRRRAHRRHVRGGLSAPEQRADRGVPGLGRRPIGGPVLAAAVPGLGAQRWTLPAALPALGLAQAHDPAADPPGVARGCGPVRGQRLEDHHPPARSGGAGRGRRPPRPGRLLAAQLVRRRDASSPPCCAARCPASTGTPRA